MANFTNPRLIQQSANSFFLSVEISVVWIPPHSTDDVTGYQVYMGYLELRPYDTVSSGPAVQGRCGRGATVREQVVGEKIDGM